MRKKQKNYGGKNMGYKLGVDIGGTFTDFVLIDDEGNITPVKTPSTPGKTDFIYAGLEELSRRLGISERELLQRTDIIVHGMTICTNTLIQQRWANTWLLCTEGFRDTIEFRLGHKPERYDWWYRPPPPIVPRHKRLPVRERITWDGKVNIPLNEEDVLRNIEKMKKGGVEACAVTFLHSYADSSHERRAGELIRRELPDVELSLSSDVLPVYREYRRFSTTVINTTLKRTVGRYLENIENAFHSLGFEGQVSYIQSNGGVASSEFIQDYPVFALISGPAMGPQSGLFFASRLGYDTVVIADMGGTSFDISFVQKGKIPTVRDIDVCGYRIDFPMVDVTTLGAGGGSIAWIDSAGQLKVGPHSAEAVPGPVCYQRGGTEPTVTDANLCLGMLPDEFPEVKGFKLDKKGAEKAIQEKIASPLGLSLQAAAQGILDVVNNNMVNGCREITIARGYDPRDAVLVAGGGATPAHAYEIAKAMDIGKVVIPKIASLLCSFGGVVADSKRDYIRTHLAYLDNEDLDQLNSLYQEMEAKAYADIEKDKVSRENIDIDKLMDIRYEGEAHECTVKVPGGKITKETIEEVKEAFHQEHERLFTFRDTVAPMTVISIGVTGWGRKPEPSFPKVAKASQDPSKARKGERLAFFKGNKDSVQTPVYDGDQLVPGNVVAGPALVEEETTVIVVPPGSSLELTEHQAYLMSLD